MSLKWSVPIGLVLFSLLFSSTSSAEKKRQFHRYALQSPSYTKVRVRKAPRKKKDFSRNELGVFGGFNFGYAVTDDNTGSQPGGSTRNSMHFGILYERSFTPNWSFETGFTYAQRGVQTKVYQLGELPIPGIVKLNYLEVPLLLKYRFAPLRIGFQWYFALGINGGIAVQRSTDVMGLVDVNVGNRFRSGDFGALAAVGGRYSLNQHHSLKIEFRNTFGLVDLDKTASSFKTRGHQILVGFAWLF